jgi:hypothetical protein
MSFNEDITIYDTTSFVNYVRSDISIIIGLSRANEFEKSYQAEKQKCIDSIVEQFKVEKKKWEETKGVEYYYHEDYTEEVTYTSKTFHYNSGTLGTISYTCEMYSTPEEVASGVGMMFEVDYRSAFIGHFNKTNIDNLKNVRYYSLFCNLFSLNLMLKNVHSLIDFKKSLWYT